MAERDSAGRYVKGNKGSAGRKPRAAELDMLARFKAAVTPGDIDEITRVLVVQAKEGNRAAMKLLFNYLLGLPRQMIEVDASVSGVTLSDWQERAKERVASVEALVD